MPTTHAVTLDEARFHAAEERARALGTTPDAYISNLIDTDLLAAQSFDEMLAPVRQGFEHLSDEELDGLFVAARARAK
jgi:hypothetical protein